MEVPTASPAAHLARYTATPGARPLFLHGDALDVLTALPAERFDCCMTSPPYWGQREYEGGGIGLEATPEAYLRALLDVCAEVRRVLKPTGSFWLNLGDAYRGKRMLGLPWRAALALVDEQGWTLRNDVVWHKLKGPSNAADRLRNVHEHVFHFVRQPQRYYYDAAAIRQTPRTASVRNGAVVSATGVSGVRYRQQIERSTALSAQEKAAALSTLDRLLTEVQTGTLADFRLVIRNQQRTTHSDSERVSGRARELQERGFYALRYHPGGAMPSDVWDMAPEDTVKRAAHCAPYPEALCRLPLLATCPPDGLALDPFCGTGTTNTAAMRLERKSVGVDCSAEYLDMARARCRMLL